MPPNGVKLSDEGVYIVSKNMTAVERGIRYPIDFNRNGYVRARRIPEDPAPLAYVYGLPFIIVARGGTPLIGRQHADKLGNISLKTDANIRHNSTFTIGKVVASASFVNMPRSIQRQHRTIRNDKDYKMEQQLETVVDIVATDHHNLTILLGDNDKRTRSTLTRLMDLEDYNIECADIISEANVHVTPRELFTEHGIAFDYNAAKAKPYVNTTNPKRIKKQEETVDDDIEIMYDDDGRLAIEACMEAMPKANTVKPISEALQIKLDAIKEFDPTAITLIQDIEAMAKLTGDIKYSFTDFNSADSKRRYDLYRAWIGRYEAYMHGKDSLPDTIKDLEARIESCQRDFTRQALSELLHHHKPEAA